MMFRSAVAGQVALIDGIASTDSLNAAPSFLNYLEQVAGAHIVAWEAAKSTCFLDVTMALLLHISPEALHRGHPTRTLQSPKQAPGPSNGSPSPFVRVPDPKPHNYVLQAP